MADNTVLRIENLRKAFGDNVVIDGLDLDVKQGEVIVVIGPSGCGKSTLLRCINALEDIQGGHIWIDDEEVDGRSKNIAQIRQKLGMVFQSYDLFPHKTIIENLHSHGIAVNGCFVLGFDSDTEEDLLALPERIEALGLDLCRFAVLTPYPGTKLFEELDSAGRITTRDWSRYNQHQAVFTPKNMSAERLNAIYRQVWKEAFTWKRLFRRVLHSPWARHWYGGFILGANVGFKFLGIDKEYKPR